MWIFLAIVTAVSALLLGALVWLGYLLSGHHIEDIGQRAPQVDGDRSMLGRFRAWLNRKPPRLEYRRDAKGRFRKLWRG